MKQVQYKWKYWQLREWKCCGNLWQLLLTKRFPERNQWAPVCPDCGKTMEILKVGIVGSRSRNTQKDRNILKVTLKSLIRKAAEKGKRIHLVSGGCPKGADRFAEELAKELELGITIHYPDVEDGCPTWKYAQACYDRNTLIANDVDMLLVEWDGFSGGTHDTIKKAEGKTIIML